ncbi:hypothetical protein XHC_0493 [Xanthomonas hortorum pv. carotae str. M081]|nr:hypothetical protein XHC_0493 [Xanthomonas hortorum pv. carotae str. M081]
MSPYPNRPCMRIRGQACRWPMTGLGEAVTQKRSRACARARDPKAMEKRRDALRQ